jgi:hypothetical protein
MSSVWSAKVIANTAIPQGTAVLASFANGLRRYTSEQHALSVDTASGFANNTTRMRLEGRSKTVVVQPFAVCIIDLGTGQSGS